MTIWLLTFGMLVGLTAAVLTYMSGASLLMVLLAYSVGGTVGLLSMALTYSFDPEA